MKPAQEHHCTDAESECALGEALGEGKQNIHFSQTLADKLQNIRAGLTERIGEFPQDLRRLTHGTGFQRNGSCASHRKRPLDNPSWAVTTCVVVLMSSSSFRQS
jgi:hypothetical protein